MHSCTLVGLLGLVVLTHVTFAQDDDDDQMMEKRAMRNALVRFGRAGMRNALVRFGKRSGTDQSEDKRNGAPQPFVRFGRSAPQPFVRFGRSGQTEHIHDILATIERLNTAEDY